MINATFLLVASLVIIVEAVRRLLHHPTHIGRLSAMIVAAVAAVAMIGDALILKGDDTDDDDLHMRSVILDTVATAAAAAAVAVAGGIIFITKRFYWLDSALAGLIWARRRVPRREARTRRHQDTQKTNLSGSSIAIMTIPAGWWLDFVPG